MRNFYVKCVKGFKIRNEFWFIWVCLYCYRLKFFYFFKLLFVLCINVLKFRENLWKKKKNLYIVCYRGKEKDYYGM